MPAPSEALRARRRPPRSALVALPRAVSEGAPTVFPVHTALDGLYPTERLLRGRSLSANTAASGGNASLMALD